MKIKGFSRILLATDGSDQADAAARVAASFAHASGARVRVVNVWNLEVYEHHGVWDVVTHRQARALITESVQRIRALGVEADGQLIRADRRDVARSIAEAADAYQADLVVVGSRGLSDWQSVLKHSVSHELLTALDCPLLVVRGAAGVAVRDSRRVLLAIAGGDDVEPGVRAAIAAAAAPASKVLVVHVVQAIFSPQGFAYVEPHAEAQATLSTAIEMLRGAGISTEAVAAPSGHVADVVAETAARWKADVIVLGSSRMGDLASILFGSVAHALLRGPGRPVLVAGRHQA